MVGVSYCTVCLIGYYFRLLMVAHCIAVLFVDINQPAITDSDGVKMMHMIIMTVIIRMMLKSHNNYYYFCLMAILPSEPGQPDPLVSASPSFTGQSFIDFSGIRHVGKGR